MRLHYFCCLKNVFNRHSPFLELIYFSNILLKCNVSVSIDIHDRVLQAGTRYSSGWTQNTKTALQMELKDLNYVLKIAEHLPQSAKKWVFVLHQCDCKSDSRQTQRGKWQSTAYLIFFWFIVFLIQCDSRLASYFYDTDDQEVINSHHWDILTKRITIIKHSIYNSYLSKQFDIKIQSFLNISRSSNNWKKPRSSSSKPTVECTRLIEYLYSGPPY